MNFCGCCGNEITIGGPDAEWCYSCVGHLATDEHMPPWDRTWFAQFRTECPYSPSGGPDGGIALGVAA